MSANLSKESLDKIEKLIPRYPETRSALLPILHIFQEENRVITKEDMEWIAGKLDLEPIQVFEVVTFYPMFKEEKLGKRHVKVCRTLSCALRGGYKVCDKLQEALNCKLNETSEDGNYTIEFVECIASCGTAPVVQVDDVLHENITPEKVDEFVAKLKEETEVKMSGGVA